jgi:hypothetical protein
LVMVGLTTHPWLLLVASEGNMAAPTKQPQL